MNLSVDLIIDSGFAHMIQSLPKSLSSEPCIEIQVISCKIENSRKQISREIEISDVIGLEHLGQYKY